MEAHHDGTVSDHAVEQPIRHAGGGAAVRASGEVPAEIAAVGRVAGESTETLDVDESYPINVPGEPPRIRPAQWKIGPAHRAAETSISCINSSYLAIHRASRARRPSCRAFAGEHQDGLPRDRSRPGAATGGRGAQGRLRTSVSKRDSPPPGGGPSPRARLNTRPCSESRPACAESDQGGATPSFLRPPSRQRLPNGPSLRAERPPGGPHEGVPVVGPL
jgi:hypothetical protein